MQPPLRLTLTDYLDPTRWRWLLSDAKGGFLADHSVHLDSSSREYQGFRNLAGYLDYYRAAYPPERQLADLGDWIGEQVFGGLRDKLWQHRAKPARPVLVSVPREAQDLLFLPFELARFATGDTLRTAGIRLVYQVDGAASSSADKPTSSSLRILAAFSLPVQENPLNLRRERYGLQRLVGELSQTQGLALELRVLQYGATRAMLADALQEGEGWDIVHLSGHGGQGELLLENDQGGTDKVGAQALEELLAPARERLKLLILDACYSGAGSHAAARAALGLDKAPTRETGGQDAAPAETARTVLPSLAQHLAEQLDCAALAMRYPVGDAFATDLMLALYRKLLDKRQALPAALHLALDAALAGDGLPLSAATPILIGARAAALQLTAPLRALDAISLPATGLGIAFPEQPERFVGRLQPMLRASQALASGSPQRGVLFHGMPGAGKTACALELAYRHAEGRFAGHVWYAGPQAGSDIATALFNLLFEIERQLNAPGLCLATALDDPQRFRQYTLPRLRGLLQQYSLLLVLDNLENLLSDSGNWRDPLWGEVLAALLGHNGPSRLVLTSRRLPADLAQHPKLQREAIHALSFAESVLLARELPHLNALFGDEAGLELLQRSLLAMQGHPKLLELADGLAADRAKLAERLAAAEAEQASHGAELDAFFAAGTAHEGESRRSDADFMQALRGWTQGIAAGLTPAARCLFQVLSLLEPEDRRRDIIETTWQHILNRWAQQPPDAQDRSHAPRGNAAPDALRPEGPTNARHPSGETLESQGMDQHGTHSVPGCIPTGTLGTMEEALAELEHAGLVGVERPPELGPPQRAALAVHLAQQEAAPPLETVREQIRQQATGYTLHPGVAEAARAEADAKLVEATDWELGDYHIARYQHGRKTEMQGGGGLVVDAARRAAPYLLRCRRWEAASRLLEHMLARDASSATLAYALPLLRRIVDATQGTDEGLQYVGLLAKTLAQAGHSEQTEALLRDVVARAMAQQQYKLAGGVASELLDLLHTSGQLQDSLALAEQMAGYTRLAGLGPWTQLAGECQRLQVLAAMGRYEEVLSEVERLRPQLAALPEQSEAEETANPWNVREALLDTGRSAALRSEHYEQALALNADIVRFKTQRGANPLQLAGSRFNDHGPLLRLQRYSEVRALLLECRTVYEKARAIPQLGRVFGALADLEDRTGDRAAAVRFEEIALGYKYQAGQPEDCAISHNNLGNYLQRRNAQPATVLAQRLAAAVIWLQTQSGHLRTVLGNLAITGLPPQPPTFDAVAEAVEQTDGVRFRALFERLPRTAPDGDAAIAAVWRMVEEERQRRAEALEPLLQAIAAVALGDDGPRTAIEALLPQFEAQGWQLADPVRRIWQGERDAAALTADIDGNSAALVRRVLECIKP